VHVAVVGFGRMGESVAVHVARMPLGAAKPRLTLIDPDVSARLLSFRRRYPGVDAVCELRTHAEELHDGQLVRQSLEGAHAESPLSAVVVSLRDEHLALRCALAVADWCGRLAPAVPVFVRTTGEHGLAPLLDGTARGPTPIAFGTIDESCSPEFVLNERLDRLAQAIHEQYRETELGKGSPPWSQLPEDLRDSNRKAADHIPVKLASVSRWAAPLGSALPAAPFTKEEVETLAALEHARWCAERMLGGWTFGEVKDVAARKSPHLVSYGKLTEKVKDGDREPVLAIADNLAALGLEIVKA
jgi:hypothetical protein